MNPEIWGGVECTVNRVGDRYFDQLERNGHARRSADLDALAEMGLRTLRYPVLWERVQPHSRSRFDWAWSDERLARLQELGIRPVLGLLHHGSGPMWTNLLDPDFPSKLADYALEVAKRYPWVDAYTPVNEPLTTARFSGLYGHWFPHRKDDGAFVDALLNQVEGTARAMEAIRSVQPKAILVQTEDLGRVFSTPLLKYQADFENERRWVSFDLLNGKFREDHPLWRFIARSDSARRQCDYLASHPTPPDIYGINYYVTSERFLDENLDDHPTGTHGGNGFHSYADVAAVRARPEGLSGLGSVLREAWDRYGAPMAMTEVHLGCTREEQVRWLMEAWHTGQRLVEDGVNIRAITTWALLGAFDWNGLVTHQHGDYEPGAFDLRGPSPRPTAVASAVRSITRTGDFSHAILENKGWWHHPAVHEGANPRESVNGNAPRPILILGGGGSVGQGLSRVCLSRGLACRALSRYQADVCDEFSIIRAMDKYRPWAVINAAGYTLIDEAEFDSQRCFEVNADGASLVARICAGTGLPYVTFSSELVFDGGKPGPYFESDTTAPLNVLGESKKAAEEKISRSHPDALIIRTSSLFSAWSTSHFAAEALRPGSELTVPLGEISPTYLPDLCHAALDLLIDGESGIWHLTNDGALSWRDFAAQLCLRFDALHPILRIVECDSLPARRPWQGVLRSERARMMPSLESALGRFHDEFLPTFHHLAGLAPLG